MPLTRNRSNMSSYEDYIPTCNEQTVEYVEAISCCTDVMYKIKTFMFIFMKTLLIVLSISFIHWLSVTIYYYWCHEKTYLGIITNIFVVGSPICLALNKLQVILSENYMAFIISCGVGFGMFIKGIID